MPSAATGETLAERAQRILGLDLDTWLSTELKSSSPPSRSSRGEQIAQAQRKHRQRTQSYIQALEEEVFRLRNVELTLKGEVDEFRRRLKSVPEDSLEGGSKTPCTEGQSEGWEGTTQEKEMAIVVNWGELLQTPAEAPCCIKAAEETPPEIQWTLGTDNVSADEPAPSMWADLLTDTQVTLEDTPGDICGDRMNVDVQHGSPLLSLQMGVNYILQLEKPCLSHLKHAMHMEPQKEGYLEAPYNYGTNHAYNLSTRLYHEHAHEPGALLEESQVSESDLENLFQASERLQLIDELTPVQVWALFRKLDSLNPIDPVLLGTMFDELSKHSYCNSFGSAVSKATLRAAFKHFLGWSCEF